MSFTWGCMFCMSQRFAWRWRYGCTADSGSSINLMRTNLGCPIHSRRLRMGGVAPAHSSIFIGACGLTEGPDFSRAVKSLPRKPFRSAEGRSVGAAETTELPSSVTAKFPVKPLAPLQIFQALVITRDICQKKFA
jgi:hypothetical protein